jgi:hypothetical protein
MATALFIKTTDIIKKTSMSGSVDSNKFLQFVELAQEIDLQPLLGTDLYDKIGNDIVGGVLTGDYKILVDEYIKPLLIQLGMVKYLPFAAYAIGNGGIYKHLPSDSDIVPKEEIDYLIQQHRDFASHYSDRLVEHLCYHARTKYPEYYTNNEDDIHPEDNTIYTTWNIN